MQQLTGEPMIPFLLLALLQGTAPPAPPPSPPAIHHPYPPGSRTVHTLYTCTDGHRAVTLQYGQARQAVFGSLSRNDVAAAQPVLEELNRLVAPFTHISGVDPQCGAKEDTLFVSGLVGKRRSMMVIYWTPSGARLAMSDLPAAAR